MTTYLAQHAPANARVLNNLGVICWQEGDPTAALRWFQKALEAAPHDEATLYNCADILSALGQGDEAWLLLASRRAPALLAA